MHKRECSLSVVERRIMEDVGLCIQSRDGFDVPLGSPLGDVVVSTYRCRWCRGGSIEWFTIKEKITERDGE